MAEPSEHKILIIYASSGAGHKTASRAVEQALRDRGFAGEIKLVDSLDYTFKPIAALFSKGYLFMATRLPWLWYAIYESGVQLSKFKPPSIFRRRLMEYLFKDVTELLKRERPDYIFSAYFSTSYTAGSYKVDYNQSCWVATIVTDYGVHPSWLNPNQDRYFTATEDIRLEVGRFEKYTSVPIENIEVVGIPVEKRFSDHFEKKEIRREFELDEDKFTVLIISGVYGRSYYEPLLYNLLRCQQPLQVIVAAGEDNGLNNKLKQRLEEKGIKCSLYGKVPFLHKLMAASDVAITKTGGLTSTECYSAGCPLLIYLPYPGQEERNASLFLEYGAAKRLFQLESLPAKIDAMASDPSICRTMIENASKFIVRDSADRIARIIIRDLKG